MNPIALLLIILGAMLIAVGAFLALRRSKITGGVVALVGVVLVSLPFAVSTILAR